LTVTELTTRKSIGLLLYQEPGHSIGSEHTNSLTRDPTLPGRKHWPVTRFHLCLKVRAQQRIHV